MDNSEPRLSANELGNFVFATDAAKKRILRSQKFPKPVIVSRYQPASSAILRAFKGGVFSEAAISEEIELLSGKVAGTKSQAERTAANIRALKKFLPLCEKAAPAAGKHSIIRRGASFEFEGVTISVRPDILTENLDGKFFTYSKLRFSGLKYSADASEVVLLLIQKFAERQNFDLMSFDASRAQLIDCFSQQIFQAHEVSPYKGQLLMKSLKEVRALWPFIERD